MQGERATAGFDFGRYLLFSGADINVRRVFVKSEFFFNYDDREFFVFYIFLYSKLD